MRYLRTFPSFFLLAVLLGACSGGGGGAGASSPNPGSPAPNGGSANPASLGSGSGVGAGTGEAAAPTASPPPGTSASDSSGSGSTPASRTPQNNAGNATLPAGPVARFAYAAASNDRILYHTVDAYTGRQRVSGYLYLGTGIKPQAVTVSPSSQYLYAVNGNNTVTAYAIAPDTGTLSQVGTPQPTGNNPGRAIFHPSGKFLYVGGSPNISVYQVNAGTGELTPAGGANPAAAASVLKVTPDGRFLYALSGNNVLGYRVDPNTGGLTQTGSVAVPGALYAAVNPAGTFLYVIGFGGQSPGYHILTYRIDPNTGQLSQTAVFNDDGPANLARIAFDHAGKVAYVSAYNGFVRSFSVDPNTGALTQMQDSASGDLAIAGAMAVDPSGQYLYVKSQSSLGSQLYISGYQTLGIDTSTGRLSLLSFTGSAGLAIAAGTKPLIYTSSTAYVTNFDSNTISVYSIDPANGNLNSVATTPTGRNPFAVAVDPDNRFLYTTNFGDNTVSAFRIDGSNGTLTPIGSFPTGVNPKAVAVDPSGRFLYVVDYGSHDLMAYRIDPGTGALSSLGGPVPLGQNPNAITIDPEGYYLYVTNYNDTVSGFAIDGATGVLSALAKQPYPGGTHPYAIAMDPQRQTLYVTNLDGRMSPLKFVDTTGVLLPKDQYASYVYQDAPYPVGALPYGITVDPYGRFLYVADGGSNNITGFRLGLFGGVARLSGSSSFGAGTNTQNIRVDAAGRFLYGINYDSNDVWVYNINQFNGALNHTGTVAAGTHPDFIALLHRIQ